MNAGAMEQALSATEGHDENRDRTTALLNAMPIPLLVCDTSGRPECWNASLADLLGVPVGNAYEGIGVSAVDTVASALPMLFDVCSALVSDDAPPASVATLATAAGERAFALDGVRDLGNPFVPNGIVVALREVTAERSLSVQLHAAREEIVQFKYHVSHDLSAPIASARGLLGLIEDDMASGAFEEVPEMLAETRAQLSRLQRLIGDLMSLARVSADVTEPEVVDLRELVDEIVASIGLHSRELEISVTLSFATPTLTIDRVRLRQILANLISNARKFQDPEEIAPYIHVSVEDDGDDWRISVSDNGIGMNQKTADRAFDMFTRGSSAHPGHGLGLHIVLKHVDRLGGRVSVGGISKPTRLDVRLPKVSSTRGDSVSTGTD